MKTIEIVLCIATSRLHYLAQVCKK